MKILPVLSAEHPTISQQAGWSISALAVALNVPLAIGKIITWVVGNSADLLADRMDNRQPDHQAETCWSEVTSC